MALPVTLGAWSLELGAWGLVLRAWGKLGGRVQRGRLMKSEPLQRTSSTVDLEKKRAGCKSSG